MELYRDRQQVVTRNTKCSYVYTSAAEAEERYQGICSLLPAYCGPTLRQMCDSKAAVHGGGFFLQIQRPLLYRGIDFRPPHATVDDAHIPHLTWCPSYGEALAGSEGWGMWNRELEESMLLSHWKQTAAWAHRKLLPSLPCWHPAPAGQSRKHFWDHKSSLK